MSNAAEDQVDFEAEEPAFDSTSNGGNHPTGWSNEEGKESSSEQRNFRRDPDDEFGGRTEEEYNRYCLFVSRFGPSTTEEDFKAFFSAIGNVVDVKIRRDIAFVEYEHAEDAARAKDELHRSSGLSSESLIVDFRKTRYPREPRGYDRGYEKGGYQGGRGGGGYRGSHDYRDDGGSRGAPRDDYSYDAGGDDRRGLPIAEGLRTSRGRPTHSRGGEADGGYDGYDGPPPAQSRRVDGAGGRGSAGPPRSYPPRYVPDEPRYDRADYRGPPRAAPSYDRGDEAGEVRGGGGYPKGGGGYDRGYANDQYARGPPPPSRFSDGYSDDRRGGYEPAPYGGRGGGGRGAPHYDDRGGRGGGRGRSAPPVDYAPVDYDDRGPPAGRGRGAPRFSTGPPPVYDHGADEYYDAGPPRGRGAPVNKRPREDFSYSTDSPSDPPARNGPQDGGGRGGGYPGRGGGGGRGRGGSGRGDFH